MDLSPAKEGRRVKGENHEPTFRQHLPHTCDTHAAFAGVEAHLRRADERGFGPFCFWRRLYRTAEMRDQRQRRGRMLSAWANMLPTYPRGQCQTCLLWQEPRMRRPRRLRQTIAQSALATGSN